MTAGGTGRGARPWPLRHIRHHSEGAACRPGSAPHPCFFAAHPSGIDGLGIRSTTSGAASSGEAAPRPNFFAARPRVSGGLGSIQGHFELRVSCARASRLSPSAGLKASATLGLVLNDGSRRDNAALWKGGASAPPPPGAQQAGPLGPEAAFLQGLKPPMTSRFPWRG
jgi:hypothetical protein